MSDSIIKAAGAAIRGAVNCSQSDMAEGADERAYEAAARAVFALIREPTDRMADKGESSLICGPLPEDIDDSPSMSWAHAKSCWKAMIDQALSE